VKGGHSYDDSNILALPSKKRKTKVQTKDEPYRKKLTKKQIKEYKCIIVRKEKKAKVCHILYITCKLKLF